ncbi:MAG: nucleotidyltransferase family protein [Campylobacteraceae bacterium]|nr:nucleotidyltransferase family protein [Campylobacteraceae bacterium]
MEKYNNLAILILAAGTSSRLGQAKQLVKYQKKTLLENACINALKISENVFVVLGSRQNECKETIKNLNVNVISNKEYKDGLSSSIKAGILELLSFKKVLIMLCDQPFIPISHFKKLIKESEENNTIICSLYDNKIAVPAIFPENKFSLLIKLEGDKGAKDIIKNNEHKYIVLDNKFSLDIDEESDLKKLKEV